MKVALLKNVHGALKPIIILLLLAAAFACFILLTEPLWGLVFILATIIYAAYAVKPIYAVLVLLIIRPALDQYSAYINLQLPTTPPLTIEGTSVFSIISIIFTGLVIANILLTQESARHKWRQLWHNKTFWALLLLLAVSAISTAYTIFWKPSVLEIGRFVSIILYFPVFYLYVAGYRQFRELAYALYLATIIPFGAALYQLVTGQGIISNIGEQSRIYGTFAHPSHLAIFAFIVFTVAATMFIYTQTISKKIDKISLLIGAVSAGVLLLTSSRTAFAALVIFVLIIGLAKYRKALLIILAVLAIFVLLYNPLYERLANITDNSIYSSGRWRTDYWHDIYAYRVSERPFLGHGTGSAVYVAESLWGYNAGLYSYDPHNDYLLMLMELGYLGLLIYLTFFASVFCTIGKYLKKFPQEKTFILAIIALIIGVMIISGLDNVFRGTAIMIIFISLTGGLLGYIQNKLVK